MASREQLPGHVVGDWRIEYRKSTELSKWSLAWSQDFFMTGISRARAKACLTERRVAHRKQEPSAPSSLEFQPKIHQLQRSLCLIAVKPQAQQLMRVSHDNVQKYIHDFWPHKIQVPDLFICSIFFPLPRFFGCLATSYFLSHDPNVRFRSTSQLNHWALWPEAIWC